MGIEDKDVDEFVELNRGSTMQIVEAYENELNCMLALKREKMSLFITNARAEIQQLWEDLLMGETDREAFAAFYDGQ